MRSLKFQLTLTFLCIVLQGCAQLSKPAYTPEQLAAINQVQLVTYDSLPANKHIQIIGTAVGKYETTYGSADEMMQEIKIGAYQAGGNGYLSTVKTSDYIQLTSTTVVTGKSPIVKFIEPTKEVSLADYSKGINGGLVSYSASRFSATYPESVDVSKKILAESLQCNCSNVKIVHKAQEILVSQLGHDAVAVLMPYIKSDNNGDSANALKEFARVANSSDADEIERILRYHKLQKVQLEAAKILVHLGSRSAVEDYAVSADAKLKARC